MMSWFYSLVMVYDQTDTSTWPPVHSPPKFSVLPLTHPFFRFSSVPSQKTFTTFFSEAAFPHSHALSIYKDMTNTDSLRDFMEAVLF